MTKEELLQVSKPILFNTEMTKAILDGRKSVTRRAIKLDLGMAGTDKLDNSYLYVPTDTQEGYIHAKHLCRYQKGDYIYVRETWAIQSMSNSDKRIKFMYRADGDKDLEIRFATDDRYDELIKYECKNGWQPSLFMPKEATRIFLKVTDVRVEKLQDMELQDFMSEGVQLRFPNVIDQFTKDIAKGQFIEVWNSTANKKDLKSYSWDANPFVWVIEFERVEVNG